jgi:hypothetical protein
LEHLEAEGFTIEAVERSKLGIVELVSESKPSGWEPYCWVVDALWLRDLALR